MSRVGEKPIPVPQNVKVRIDGVQVILEGPRGKLQQSLPEGIQLEIQDGVLIATRAHESQAPLHGLVRTLVANSIVGITKGFSKELEIVGIGYRAEVKGKTLICTLGYSHPVEFGIPQGISITVDRQTRMVVSGTDKQQVGQVAADIRALRPPDPYKNKGIRYVGEVLRKKVGKGAVGAPTK
jgi:large subunit ribosomal protein L6